jgi:hypothetical protein
MAAAAEQPESPGEGGHSAGGAPSVDPEVIADRVYELMRAEARLEIVRGGAGSQGKE